MSHIAEGELTAHADGAYAPDDAAGRRIADHLGQCANCRNRLAQAQALSGRAGEILATAAPQAVRAHDFNEVRAAAALPRRRIPAIPLTWAATVLLALGLGWFGRDLLVPARTEVANKSAAPGPAAAPNIAETARTLSTAARATADTTPVRVAARPSAPTGRVAEPIAPPAAADLAPAAAPADLAAREGNAPPPSMMQAAAQKLQAFAPAVSYITLAEAERRGIAVHMVPELPVVRIALSDTQTLVEQQLPEGKLLTITAWSQALARAEATESAGALQRRDAVVGRLNEAARQPAPVLDPLSVVVTRGITMIRLTAPVSLDSLKILAEKVR